MGKVMRTVRTSGADLPREGHVKGTIGRITKTGWAKSSKKRNLADGSREKSKTRTGSPFGLGHQPCKPKT